MKIRAALASADPLTKKKLLQKAKFDRTKFCLLQEKEPSFYLLSIISYSLR